jgi:colicin import membrane protein
VNTEKLSRYQLPITVALLLHLVLLSLLMMDFRPEPRRYTVSQAKQPKIIHAQAVSQKSIENEIKQIKHERAAKRRREWLHQKRLKAKAAKLKARRLAEEARLRKAKLALKKLKNEQRKKIAAAKKHLSKLQKQQLLAKKKLKAQRKKAAAQKKRLAKIAKAKAEQERKEEALAKQLAAREALKARQLAMIRGKVDKAKALILEAISQEWLVPENVSKTLRCKLRIRLAPDGTVLTVELVRSSGDSVYDRSAKLAVYKASPLPVPAERDVFEQFRSFNLIVRPEKIIQQG